MSVPPRDANVTRFWQTSEFQAGVLSGALLALSKPPGWLGPLAWVALVPMLVVLFSSRRQREGDPLRWKTLALSFAFSHHLLVLHWLVLLGDASPFGPKWAMPFLLALLVLYSTVPDLLVVGILARIRGRHGNRAIWWVPAVWIVGEWARQFGDLGFPWLSLGTTQLRVLPVLQIAGVLGELGVALFVIWVNLLVTLIWMRRRGEFPRIGPTVLARMWAPATLILLFGAVLLHGMTVLNSAGAGDSEGDGLVVGLVQADVDLFDKWDVAKRDSTFVPYTLGTEAVAAEGARLTVWAETALTFDIRSRRAEFERMARLSRETGSFILTGYVERQIDEEGKLDSSNSAMLLGPDGEIHGNYRKMHLLSFGEAMPFQSIIPAMRRVDFGQAEWKPGEERTLFEVDGHRFGVLICFESIFSRFGRDAVVSGAGMLVNITNDGWFGDTILPRQHAWMAVMRAVENRVPVVRVANNGLSFVAEPTGRVLGMTGLFTREHFALRVTPNPEGSFYSKFGDGPLFAILAFGSIFLLLIGRREEGRSVD
jgi:apolipoprotein N-acyltransferase